MYVADKNNQGLERHDKVSNNSMSISIVSPKGIPLMLFISDYSAIIIGNVFRNC